MVTHTMTPEQEEQWVRDMGRIAALPPRERLVNAPVAHDESWRNLPLGSPERLAARTAALIEARRNA